MVNVNAGLAARTHAANAPSPLIQDPFARPVAGATAYSPTIITTESLPLPGAPTADEYFAGRVGRRVEAIRFDVLDRDRNPLGTLAVDRDTSPRITNDVSRSLRRQVEGLHVLPRPVGDQDPTRFYADELDTLTMRVKPWWIVSGLTTPFPLGVFVLADDNAEVYSWGEPRSMSGVDYCHTLAQPLSQNVGYPAGWLITDALRTEADRWGIGGSERVIDSSATRISEPVAWAAGRDTGLKVMESLCALAGFFPPYFDNNGLLRCVHATDLATAQPAYTYGYGVGAVLAGSILRSSDILDAPNRYVAIDTSAQKGPVVGIYDVPASAPHSYAHRGFFVVRTVELQGLESQEAATAAAAAAAASDSATYSWLAFDTPPDPRHDTFDVLSFDGVNYRQQGWSLECKAGGTHSHDCRGTYQ